MGVGQFVAGVSIGAIGLTAGAAPGSVSPETIRALGIVYGPGTAILGIAALVVLTGYRLDCKRHAEIVIELEARRAGRRGTDSNELKL